MEAPGKTQHKVVLLFWLLKIPWCICFSFAVIYLALLLSAVYTPPPHPSALRHQLPSPFPHGEHLLWEMYSLEDNKGLIGKTSLWAVCWKQAKRQRERMWWHYTPDVFTQVVALIFFSSLLFLFSSIVFLPLAAEVHVYREYRHSRDCTCVMLEEIRPLHYTACHANLKTISFYYGCCDFVSIRATSGEDIFTFN